MDIHDIDWQQLRTPFDPSEVDFRIQSTFEREGKKQAVVVAYIDARAVQDRLDAVVGPENWAFDWEPLAVANGTVTVAKGTLTICGVSKSDVGDSGKTEPTKASVSDALKRAAVMWGIGRYIYALGTMFTGVEMHGKNETIPAGELRRLRAALATPHAESAPTTAASQATHKAATPSASATPAAPGAPQQHAVRPAPSRPATAAATQWTDALGYNPLGDRSLMARFKAVGADNIAKVEAALTKVKESGEYTHDSIYAYLARVEAFRRRQAAAPAADEADDSGEPDETEANEPNLLRPA